MKKFIICTLSLLVVGIGNLQAEVQNIKISGDIRIRTIYSDGISTSGNDQYDAVYQRTRLNVESDLTDDVLAGGTFEAKNRWGSNDAVLVGSTTKTWDSGISQAYLILDNFIKTDVSLKLGRQYLHFGQGFIISSKEEEYNFDAAKMTINLVPWVLDLVCAVLVENDTASGDIKDKNLVGANLGYLGGDWKAEAYIWKMLDSSQEEVATQIPAYKPLILGVRGDTGLLNERLKVWGEVALEKGKASPTQNYATAYALDFGGIYTFDLDKFNPMMRLNYTMGSGDSASSGDTNRFDQLYEYDYYGHVFSPVVSNIEILNVCFTILPLVDLQIALDYFYYRQNKAVAQSMADINQDNGGLAILTNGRNKNLGNELDVTATYSYSEDVKTQLLAGWFKPGGAYQNTADDDTAYEIRGEILVNF